MSMIEFIGLFHGVIEEELDWIYRFIYLRVTLVHQTCFSLSQSFSKLFHLQTAMSSCFIVVVNAVVVVVFSFKFIAFICALTFCGCC